MRSFTFLVSVTLLSCSSLFAQDGLPPNPEPGKCYIRCITEDKWGEQQKVILEQPAYKKLEVVPAEYKLVKDSVLIKPATKRFEYIPAVFKTVVDTIQVVEPYNKIDVIPAKLSVSAVDVIYQPSYARFEWKSDIENCKSDDPRDCMVLCYVEYPEQKNPVPTKTLDADATTSTSPVKGKIITIKKEVMVTPPQVKEIEIPAEFRVVDRQVLVKDETVKEVISEAIYRNETVRVLEEKGGMEVWEEIDCNLTDLNVLPIFYELNSARITSDSRKIIDDKLFKLMNEKRNIRVELNSHTDSRGTKEANMDLSQRRAQSVVDYLVSKGISSTRLIARGYGETRLVNKCADGVECTEAEHAKNRRTEFRVLSN
jgi:outer membrane protein OmpA-like peptidoglycan-associated protein